ncbi:hypothetical protein TWF281_003101 [Arthrobotrys megalospora]
MASRFSSKADFAKYLKTKPLPLPPPPSTPSPESVISEDTIPQFISQKSRARMTSKIPRGAAPAGSSSQAAGADAPDVYIPDITEIERKQQFAMQLVEQGKIREATDLGEEVARDLQVYQQWCLAEKVRRLKVGVAIQEEAIRLFRGRESSLETLVPFDELFERAVDREMRVDREAHDLLLPGPQFERLVKKLRVTAQVLEAVYQDCIKGAAAAQVQQYARYYHAFCFPVCLNHKVFSPSEFKELGLRFQQPGAEGEEEKDNEGH